MSAESPPNGLLMDEAIQAQVREYEAQRRREYESAMAHLEGQGIEPEQHAAYAGTLAEMLALPLGELVWPRDDPRTGLHRALEYGEMLEARRAEIVRRWGDSLPLDEVFSIRRYALATLHAFKAWRAHPEPEASFGKLIKDAARLRSLLVACAASLILHDWMAADELRNYDGGLTLESIACDLFLLIGITQGLPPRSRSCMPSQLRLMEGALLAKTLLQHATGKLKHAEPWQPRLLYARAYWLLDNTSVHAELMLSTFHNEERDPRHYGEWKPECLLCQSQLERARHHRHKEPPIATQRRAQFTSLTMTAALRHVVVDN